MEPIDKSSINMWEVIWTIMLMAMTQECPEQRPAPLSGVIARPHQGALINNVQWVHIPVLVNLTAWSPDLGEHCKGESVTQMYKDLMTAAFLKYHNMVAANFQSDSPTPTPTGRKLLGFQDGVLGATGTRLGRSTANQRIESWWGIYRRQNVDYWRDVFQEFQATGDFNGDFIDKGLIQFCFLKIIQNELDTVVTMWDNHRIRPGGNGRALYHGKPCLMYNVPELYHAQDYLHPIQYERVDTVLQEDVCLWKTDIPCDHDLHELCLLVMEENNIAVS
ncbi:hypothetical protein SKAU_G00020350 [Synaphobranchus kaupii]|uniref:Integrase core domain-containing protein n=1 Tax=Synaphobranchus kaupii TaxID=118154 RepID=A0A9Q1GDI7_SYNKA|nr:hypothetical protein SKAU_G00020350 [Synaphobranchus kaupii]